MAWSTIHDSNLFWFCTCTWFNIVGLEFVCVECVGSLHELVGWGWDVSQVVRWSLAVFIVQSCDGGFEHCFDLPGACKTWFAKWFSRSMVKIVSSSYRFILLRNKEFQLIFACVRFGVPEVLPSIGVPNRTKRSHLLEQKGKTVLIIVIFEYCSWLLKLYICSKSCSAVTCG